MRGKVAVGLDSSDTDFNVLGKTGGEKTHTLTNSEIPNLSINTSTSDPNGSTPNGEHLGYGSNSDIQFRNYSINTGGNQPHNNLQPYVVCNYIIKAKKSTVSNSEKVTDIYSTEEVKTNKIWINGKPIYRKVFQFIADSHNYVYTHNTPNIEFITDVYGMAGGYPIPYASITNTYIIEIWTEPTRFGIKSGTSINLDRTYYITLEYTKTTDTV